MPTFHGVPNHQELEARQLLQPRILLSRLSDVYVRRRRPSACVSQPSIVLVGRVPDWRRWSSLFTIPDPLHEGSSRLYARAGPISPDRPRRLAARLHVRDGGVPHVVGRNGQEVGVDGLNILTTRPGQHCPQRGEALAVALKGKELVPVRLSLGLGGKNAGNAAHLALVVHHRT